MSLSAPPYRLLLVDDNPDDIQLAILALKRTNRPMQLEVLTNGHEAVEAILAQPPDLVIMDINLPLLNGLEVLKAVRAEYPRGTLPLIILTTSTAVRDCQQAHELGCDAFYVKPLSFHDFVRLLTEILERWMIERPDLADKKP